MGLKIFISYRRDGGDVTAKLISEALKTRGFSVFYDYDSLKGGAFDVGISTAIDQCDAFVLVLPKNALKRCRGKGDILRHEIRCALEKGKNIVPVMLDRFEFPKRLPKDISEVSRYNAVRFHMDRFESTIDGIVERLSPQGASDKPESSYGLFVNASPSADCATLRSGAENSGGSRPTDDENVERSEFLRVIGSDDFKKFTCEVMERYYGLEFFSTFKGEPYPVFSIEGNGQRARSIKDFDQLCDFEGSKLSGFKISEHLDYTSNKWYPEYSRILDGKVRYPNRPGYMVDEIVTDQCGRFEGIRAHVGTYAENLSMSFTEPFLNTAIRIYPIL